MYLRNCRIALFLALLFVGSPAFAQDEEPQEKGDVRVTKAPQLVESATADYTQAAVDARIEGPVKLRLTISDTGKVTKVEVLEGLGYGLDEAAVAAAKQFVFEPAEINGAPSSVVLTFTINFSLPILPSALEGRVVDSVSGSGVEARVNIVYVGDEYDPAPEAELLTEPDGTFAFAEIPPGEYKVTLQVKGYDPYESTIELLPGETSEIGFRVDASPENFVGTVRETGTRKPLSAVKVQLWTPDGDEPFAEAYTDKEGRFAFRGVPVGSYTLRLSATGYFTSTSEGLQVLTGEVTDGTFLIEAEYYDEYTVKTVAKRARTEIAKRRLELEEVRRIPGTGGDVVRVVQNLPGVARAPALSGLLIVRGSSPQDTRIYLDGDEIPIVYHFLGGPAVINSEMIDAIDFYPGNFSTYYGRATGGVIDLSTRSPNDERLHGIVEADILDATILAEGPITEDLSIALSGRRSYFDVFLPLILPQDGPDIFVAPRYYDYQAWVTYKGIENHLFELIITGSDDRLEILLPPEEAVGNRDVVVDGIDFVSSFYRGLAKWQWRPNLPIENDFQLSYGFNKVSFDVAENLYFEVGLAAAQMRNDLRLKFSDHFTMRMGVDNQFGNAKVRFASPTFADQEADVDNNGEGRPNFQGDFIEEERNTPVQLPAVYLEPEIRPYDKLLLTPGLRIDHYGPLGVTTASPRFSFRWDFIDRVTAKGGVGLFTQPPLAGTEDAEFGNPNILPEKAIQYGLGGEWRPVDYFEIDATGFFRDSYDILSQTNELKLNQDGESVPIFFENEGEGRSYGVELLLRHYPQNRFFGWVAYTLSWAERLNVVTGEFDPYEYDQRHILTILAGYNLPWNVDVSGRFRLTTGNPFTPIIGSVYDADTDDYNPVYGPQNSARERTFHQLDVRVDKKWIFDGWILGAYLDVTNAYNAKNSEGTRYNYDYSDSEPVRGLPIIPSIGVKGEFWADGPVFGGGDDE